MTSLYNNVIIYIKGWEKEWVKNKLEKYLITNERL